MHPGCMYSQNLPTSSAQQVFSRYTLVGPASVSSVYLQGHPRRFGGCMSGSRVASVMRTACW